MKSYGIEIAEGTKLSNVAIEIGVAYPSEADIGELFYHTVNGLSVYTNSGWKYTVFDDDCRLSTAQELANIQTAGCLRKDSNNAWTTAPLTAGDMSTIDWASLSGKPTTVAESGIIDAISAGDCGVPLGIATLGPDGKLAVQQTVPVTTITGNAGTATALKTPRVISISSDAFGNALFDGSGNANIAVTLNTTGVTVGTYPKVTVDAKGRVTAGTTLSATDVPGLDWTKITSGKPTTLSGYGITDAAQNVAGQGQVLQMKYANLVAMSGTALIPVDATVPLSTEGALVATVTITPATTSSRFVVSGAAFVNSSASNRNITIAVFRGTQCIGASTVNIGSSGRPATAHIHLVDSPATTSSINYTIRIGANSSSTWYLNQSSAGADFGDKSTSSITVTEFS